MIFRVYLAHVGIFSLLVHRIRAFAALQNSQEVPTTSETENDRELPNAITLEQFCLSLFISNF